MLTLFSIPKPFKHPHIDTIQRNAIQSWKLMEPACEIILFGYEEGIAEIAAEMGVRHVSEIQRNEYGTPLLNNIFEQAQSMASHSILCYINADIILMSDFLPAVERVVCQKLNSFIVGRRWDMDITSQIDFGTQWERQMRSDIQKSGTLHSESGIDYFVFPRDMPINMPPFAVGRPAWDNWFLFRAQQLGYPIIDATQAITIVHQNHDYRHVPQRTGSKWEGPEEKRNIAMAGNNAYTYSTNDADYILTCKNLMPALQYKYLRRVIRRHWIIKRPHFYLFLKRIRDCKK